VPAGLGRVWALCENWLAYSRRRVFPGGCFFFAGTAEFDARPGRVRDALATAHADWTRLVTRTLTDARDLGELVADADTAQLAFEFIAFMEAANAAAVLHDDPAVYERSRAAIRRRLIDSATDPGALEPR
jgi:hypothetical protein